MSKQCKNDYFERLSARFTGVNERFDTKPYFLLMADGICALLCWVACGVAMDSQAEGIVYFSITITSLTVFLGVIYMISAILKKTRKIFPLAVTSMLVLLLSLFDMIAIGLALKDLDGLAEWIPVLLFAGLTCGWYVYMALRIRKEIRGEDIKMLSIPLWLIYIMIITLAPIVSIAVRHNLGDFVSERVFAWFWTYLVSLVNVVLARFILDLIMFCKYTILGRVQKMNDKNYLDK